MIYIELIKEYIYAMELQGYSDSTLRHRKYLLNNFADTIDKPLIEVTARDVREYLRYCKEERKNNTRTIAHKISGFKAFYNWLVDEEIIDKNPLRSMKQPKKPLEAPKYLSEEEIEELRKVAEGKDRVLLEVFYQTGIRATPCTQLNWDDVNFENNTIHIRQAKGKKDRIIPVSDDVLEWLKTLDTCNSKKYIFESREGNRMSRSTVYRRIRKLGKKSSLDKNIYPHRLRHSCATHLLDKGVPLRIIQRILGHSKVDTTQRYAITKMDQIKEEYEKVFG